jgi:hypothetical protein
MNGLKWYVVKNNMASFRERSFPSFSDDMKRTRQHVVEKILSLVPNIPTENVPAIYSKPMYETTDSFGARMERTSFATNSVFGYPIATQVMMT